MRPPKVSQFMKWRDAQPSYQEALREVLQWSQEAETLEAQGVESHHVFDAWEQSKEKLLEVEKTLLQQYETK